MGEYAEQHIEGYIQGRFGIPCPKARVYEQISKAEIAHLPFSIVEVNEDAGHKTNREPGSKLVVCDKDDSTYWVWASKKVTGIAKGVCTVLEANLPLADALARTGRKSYGPAQPETGIWAQPVTGQWDWQVAGIHGDFSGKVAAVDCRDAVSRALTTEILPGKLLGEILGPSADSVLHDAPGNADRRFFATGAGFTLYVSHKDS